MKIQLWSYNYAPEPTGIGPVSATFARAMRARGHELEVIAAHPHYPEPLWGKRRRPYSETLDGIPVRRLPLWIGRGSAGERIRQEASFAASQWLALPRLGRCDAVIAVSPCFPALSAAVANKRLRGVPWVLWLQDILPDGAVSTGIVREGPTVWAGRRLERAAYRSADKIAVISKNFERNLLSKGVPREKLAVIYNPATRPILDAPRGRPAGQPPSILVMGNIGHSQGLPELVRSFEASQKLAAIGARLVVTGTGVAAAEVAAAVTGDRVELLGLVSDERLVEQLERASIGLVTQRSDVAEFNLPSKLMNYCARGLPVVAAVPERSETAELVRSTGCGWVVDRDADVGDVIADALGDPDQLAVRGESGRSFAGERLGADALAAQFESLIASI